ncbi:MAG: hypothetical protein ISR51_08955 [Rhodospirillales bacterium]|nr:hypothetical protein [Rhodospirillales bacterium]
MTGQAPGGHNPSTSSVQLPPSGQVREYLHPVRKFIALVPVGAELAERGESVQVSIRSRKGYIINIQTGDATPAISLPQMMGKLESKYLGTGKPWSQKLQEKSSRMAGLKSIEAIYEGAGTRVRVVIAHGLKTDFVIIFFAPVESFEKLESDFKWFLTNFKPNPADLPPAERMTNKATGAASGPSPDSSVASKQFDQAGYGYVIQYPGDWDVSRPSENTATFSGKKGTPAYQVFVNIQNVRPVAAKTPAEAAEQALTDLKTSLAREARDFQVVGEKPLAYRSGNLTLSGRQIVATYTYSGERYRRWVLVLPRPTGTVAHIWSYTAPDIRFMEFRPVVDAMLKTWTIKPGGG